jgi:hypothetical protein
MSSPKSEVSSQAANFGSQIIPANLTAKSDELKKTVGENGTPKKSGSGLMGGLKGMLSGGGGAGAGAAKGGKTPQVTNLLQKFKTATRKTARMSLFGHTKTLESLLYGGEDSEHKYSYTISLDRSRRVVSKKRSKTDPTKIK